ncbi:hypothetical protein BDD43_1098 [Mucilaginibacter gracilis]|uniref:HxlR family transcriptional regulator n=1 Tax=Mucilaginibacter gracilis TaxID=423350 RepID=A0A495IWB0_9SPHI|nr:hypothetical protein [Mucilaginibacter gracilis]RKR80960.1 hypothetical protein BDD43_1098 [Mucilaginibacter gracilis]
MNERNIYKALKQIQKGTMKFSRLNLVCEKLTEMGLVRPIPTQGSIDYELTINGKVFIWDYDNWKL